MEPEPESITGRGSRGHSRLPLQAVKIMNNWIKKHRECPFPSEAAKKELQERTGLSRKKIGQWFINARRRSPLLRNRRRVRHRARPDAEGMSLPTESNVTHVGNPGTESAYCLCESHYETPQLANELFINYGHSPQLVWTWF